MQGVQEVGSLMQMRYAGIPDSTKSKRGPGDDNNKGEDVDMGKSNSKNDRTAGWSEAESQVGTKKEE